MTEPDKAWVDAWNKKAAEGFAALQEIRQLVKEYSEWRNRIRTRQSTTVSFQLIETVVKTVKCDPAERALLPLKKPTQDDLAEIPLGDLEDLIRVCEEIILPRGYGKDLL